MMLMLWPFHSVYVAADWMVIPLCRSNSIESITAPTPSLPLTYKYLPHEPKLKHISLFSSTTTETKCKLLSHLVHLWDSACVKQDSLCERCFSRINVGRNTDVSDLFICLELLNHKKNNLQWKSVATNGIVQHSANKLTRDTTKNIHCTFGELFPQISDSHSDNFKVKWHRSPS